VVNNNHIRKCGTAGVGISLNKPLFWPLLLHYYLEMLIVVPGSNPTLLCSFGHRQEGPVMSPNVLVHHLVEATHDPLIHDDLQNLPDVLLKSRRRFTHSVKLLSKLRQNVVARWWKLWMGKKLPGTSSPRPFWIAISSKSFPRAKVVACLKIR